MGAASLSEWALSARMAVRRPKSTLADGLSDGFASVRYGIPKRTNGADRGSAAWREDSPRETRRLASWRPMARGGGAAPGAGGQASGQHGVGSAAPPPERPPRGLAFEAQGMGGPGYGGKL